MAQKKKQKEEETVETMEAFICDDCDGTGITGGQIGSRYAPLCKECGGRGEIGGTSTPPKQEGDDAQTQEHDENEESGETE